MKLNTKLLAQLDAKSQVLPGNVYPAQGGRKPGTDYWLVIATTEKSCHLIGFNKEGWPVSTASYNKAAMRERPVLAQVSLSNLVLS